MSLSSKDAIKIGSAEYHFKSVKQTYETLSSENSGRTEDGIMHISFVRSKLVKLECELPPITAAELTSTWQPFLSGVYAHNNLSVTYFDLVTGAERTMTCYCSNFSGDIYSGYYYNGMWQGIKINLIEV